MSGYERTTLAPGTHVRVRLLKPSGKAIQYQAEVLADDGNHVVVRGPWAEPEARDLGFVRFEPGDVFTEHYWRDRWYSVKDVRDRDGQLKGWYCDVTRPVRVQRGSIVSPDLDLDLWVSVDGTVLRLDEDEFVASGLEQTDAAAFRHARAALAELEVLAQDRFIDIRREGSHARGAAAGAAPSRDRC